MTNEEKAYQIMRDFQSQDRDWDKYDVEDAAMEMAKWKDQQVIEYLYKNIQSLLKDYGASEASADLATQMFLANFKQAMED